MSTHPEPTRRLLRAARCLPVDRPPVWLMRQAGRYLPEYRAIREKYPILDMMRQPDLATEVTLQPLRRFPLDAAIIFADILTLPEAMGLDLSFTAGVGPRFANPIRSAADVDALRPFRAEDLDFTLEALRLTARELDDATTLIGFSGAPFTLAAYMIEGGGSKDWLTARRFMLEEPAAWDRLMDRLTDGIIDYLVAQVGAGAQIVQLFDSWAGILSEPLYRERVLPWSTRIIQTVKTQTGVPVIHFGVGTAALLDAMKEAGCDVLGIDWRTPLDQARARLGDDIALQGNLDPALLQGPEDSLRAGVRDMIRRQGSHPGYIANLGHGVDKHTSPESVGIMVDEVGRTTVQPG